MQERIIFLPVALGGGSADSGAKITRQRLGRKKVGKEAGARQTDRTKVQTAGEQKENK